MMQHATPKSARALAAPMDAVIIAAARIWREAVDDAMPVQPALHALFGPAGYDMLAPAFDSVMRLCEQHFDRKVCAECPLTPSGDETLLCRLIEDPALLDRIGPCRARSIAGGVFVTALQSLRIMLAMSRGAAVH